MSGAFDGFGHHPLVLGAGARLAARSDLAALGDVTAQQVGLFVVYGVNLLGAELTDPDLADKTSTALVAFNFFLIHSR